MPIGSTRVRRFVQLVGVRQPRGVSLGAGGARGCQGVSEAFRSVSSEFREVLQTGTAAVQAAAHIVSGVVGSHHLNMRCSPGGVNS
eukprot:6189070-Pleurochrysis_carterae.AAC.1